MNPLVTFFPWRRTAIIMACDCRGCNTEGPPATRRLLTRCSPSNLKAAELRGSGLGLAGRDPTISGLALKPESPGFTAGSHASSRIRDTHGRVNNSVAGCEDQTAADSDRDRGGPAVLIYISRALVRWWLCHHRINAVWGKGPADGSWTRSPP